MVELDLCAVGHPIGTGRDDALTGGKPLQDFRARLRATANADRPSASDALRVYDAHAESLALGDERLYRHGDGPRVDAGHDAHEHRFADAQHARGSTNPCPDRDRA